MHGDLVELGWTEEQWNRIRGTVTEEVQKARVAAQMLPVSGPEDPSTVAIPRFMLRNEPNLTPPLPHDGPASRLSVNSDPELYLTTIAVNVQLRTVDVADLALKAGLVMFRRAANHIARIEDALIFNGRPGTRRPGPNRPPSVGLTGIPPVYTVTGGGPEGGGDISGIFNPITNRLPIQISDVTSGASRGQPIVTAVVDAIAQLENRGQLGPYACVLGHELFHDVCDPTANLVLPRDRILPFLQGPLVRSSAVIDNWGAIIALSGSPVEVVIASDVDVRFLQTTLEPRYVFRVSERAAVRITDPDAIAILRKPSCVRDLV
jgi:uncharacterized linocin/CFP29 family protein